MSSIATRRSRQLTVAALVLSFVPTVVFAQRQRSNPTRPSRGDTATGRPRRGGSPPERGRLIGPDSAQRGDSANRGGPYAALKLREIGPAATSGRISEIAVSPRDKRTWFIATASGGLWKTTTAGTSFTPVFDDEKSYSIGTVVIDPHNPNVVWVGTGEGNAQRSVSYGDGVYKSEDGGHTWKNVGLGESEHIGKIVIDPRNSDVVYVAAQGPLSRGGGDRGLYKTTDGGRTWKKILESGKWAGAADVALDPRDPDIVLASMWQRERTNYGYVAGGPESGLWRSTDGGATWNKVRGPLAADDMGRIGLAFSPKNPDVVYAIAEAGGNRGGFFRSRDAGASWEKMSGETSIGLYYTKLVADPTDEDRVYSMDVMTQVTDDGGKTFRAVGERDKHVDNHAVWIDPDNADHLLIGCDGGLYETFDRGSTYQYFGNLPLGQFYRIDADNSVPFYRVYGGLQDNGSVGGPSRTRNQDGIINSDWITTAGGDGFHSRVDPTDPNIVYAESQHGNLERRDLRTGQNVNIVPQPEPGAPALRWYWDSPLVISPFSNTRLYFASQRLFRSDDRGNSWRPVSPDLSRQIDRNRLKLMGRVWPIDAVAKNTSSSFYGEIVAVAESPLKEGQLWIGTDDGRIAMSEDAGQHWRTMEHFPGVPDTTYVSRVTPSSHDANTVYASFDGHMSGDYAPYVLKSTDIGRTWKSIAGNLPDRGTVYVVIDDPKDADMLYVGTEFGLYFTRDGGNQWTRLRGGLPTIMVRDLQVQKRDDQLVVGTFGRGIWILDDLNVLRSLTPQVLASSGAVLPVARTPMFVQSPGRPGNRGGDYYSASNPPVGATIYYYLREGLRSARERRERSERAAARRGEDVFYPPWDSLHAEAREEAPAAIVTIKDDQGRTVRRLTGPVARGLNRVVWNLRYPPANPITEGNADRGGRRAEGRSGGFNRPAPSGPFVAPGTYKVSVATRVGGVETPIGQSQTFEVYNLDAELAPRTPAIVAFERQTEDLQRAVLGANAEAGEVLDRLQALRRALEETPAAGAQLGADARALETRVRDLQEALTGDPTMPRHQEPAPPSLLSRLSEVTGGAWSSTLEAPTMTQRRQYDIVSGALPGLLDRLKALESELRRVEDATEAAGAPWTPGRIPSWKP